MNNEDIVTGWFRELCNDLSDNKGEWINDLKNIKKEILNGKNNEYKILEFTKYHRNWKYRSHINLDMMTVISVLETTKYESSISNCESSLNKCVIILRVQYRYSHADFEILYRDLNIHSNVGRHPVGIEVVLLTNSNEREAKCSDLYLSHDSCIIL